MPQNGTVRTYQLAGMRPGFNLDQAMFHLSNEHNDRSPEVTAVLLRTMEKGGPEQSRGIFDLEP